MNYDTVSTEVKITSIDNDDVISFSLNVINVTINVDASHCCCYYTFWITNWLCIATLLVVLLLLGATSSKSLELHDGDEIWQECSSNKYASIDEAGFSIWRHTFSMAAMTLFHLEKCCHHGNTFLGEITSWPPCNATWWVNMYCGKSTVPSWGLAWSELLRLISLLLLILSLLDCLLIVL